MRILVCGGRDFATRSQKEIEFLYHELWAVTDQHTTGDLTIIHGGAKGADSRAGEFAYNYGIKVQVFPANWEKYGIYAGYVRNKQMLDEGKPDLVVAFPGGKGTASMVRLAREAGVEVKEISYATEQVEESTQGQYAPIGL